MSKSPFSHSLTHSRKREIAALRSPGRTLQGPTHGLASQDPGRCAGCADTRGIQDASPRPRIGAAGQLRRLATQEPFADRVLACPSDRGVQALAERNRAPTVVKRGG